MLPKKVEEILNNQIQKEDYSSQLYLSMASWAENQGFEGVSTWLYAQAEEERVHMLKLVKYVNERDGAAVIPGIDTPPTEFGDVFNMFDKVLAHEKYISGSTPLAAAVINRSPLYLVPAATLLDSGLTIGIIISKDTSFAPT